jgi:hypothetical protein
MIIVAGGDSFVWGSELSDHRHGGHDGYSRLTFPALLAADDQYICAAYPGSNNYDIRKMLIVDMVEASRIINSFSTGDDRIFVIVCWTWSSRDTWWRASADIIQDVQDRLKRTNTPYLFTCADNCLLEWLDDDTDWDNWFLFPPAEESWNTQEPRGFYQWAVENKYPVGPDGHPLEAAHQDAALLIKDKFNEMVKKHLEQNGSGNQISQETQRT